MCQVVAHDGAFLGPLWARSGTCAAENALATVGESAIQPERKRGAAIQPERKRGRALDRPLGGRHERTGAVRASGRNADRTRIKPVQRLC